MVKEFDNVERHRYYGLRVGDIVFLGFKSQSPRKLAEVTGYGFMDNNRVYVKTEDGEDTDYVAEWCEILVKVEDRNTMKTPMEVAKYLGEVQTEYDELQKKGGKGQPVDTQSWIRKLSELSAKADGLKWVLNLK
jgi:hypothetical protein